jgi:hypothetical protein
MERSDMFMLSTIDQHIYAEQAFTMNRRQIVEKFIEYAEKQLLPIQTDTFLSQRHKRRYDIINAQRTQSSSEA